MTHGSDASPEGGPDRRSLFALLRELANDAAGLVRQEITLARLEVIENIRRIGAHAGQVTAGGVVAALGLLVLVETAVIGLGALLGGSYWLSSLLVALLLIAGGGGLAYLGARRLAADPVAPAASFERARETQRWIGDEVAELQAALASPDVRAVPPPREPPARGTPLAAAESGEVPHSRASPSQATERLPAAEPIHRRVLHEVMENDLAGEAAQVAFYMFMSVPPAILVTFSLVGLYGGEELAATVTTQIGDLVPGTPEDSASAAAFVYRYIDEVVVNSAPAILSIGAAFGLWAASAVFVSLTKALNRAYDLRESRSWITRRLLAIGVMIAFLLLFLGGSLTLIAGPLIASAIGLSGEFATLWNVLQLPVPFLLVFLAFLIAYVVLPDRTRPARRSTLLTSALVATVLWTLASLGFRYYIANFGTQGETYGFVGAIMVLLLWMYLTAMTIVLGGEIGAELERRA